MSKPVAPFALLLALAALALAACGGSGDSTGSDAATFENDDYPFTFEYPGDWGTMDDITLNKQLGSLQADNVVGVGPDDNNGIFLATYTLGQPVTEDNIDQAKSAFDKLIQQVDPSAEGVVGDVGGFPSVTIESVPVSDPEGAENTLVAMFDGTSEYLLTCQSLSDQRDEVDAACEQAQSTLEKTG
jgi:hypothetical protein